VITIAQQIVRQPHGRLEPTFVRYQVRELEPVNFEPVSFQPVRRRFRSQVAALYATNRSPRDRMRHDHRWRGERMRTLRYTAMDPRQR
jgi:hypothetical protein